MSGFEIVGVVLGALPLVIEGLEMYRKGLGTLRTMKNYEETIENLLITFDSTRARYIFTCETLLAPLMLPQKQYTELINNPGAQPWSDSVLQDAISDRLGAAQDSYVGLVQRVHRALLKFAGKMEIEIQQNMKSRLPAPSAPVQGNPSGKAPSQISIQSSRVWARIRIGLENGGLERLLDAMEKDLFRLERLLDQSAKLPAIRKERKRKTSKKPWLTVRESAQSLFTAFTKRWNCPCPAAHNALLRLDVVDPSKNDHTDVNFDVFLSKSTPGPSSTVATPAWYNIRIVSHEDMPQMPTPQPKPFGHKAQTSVITFQVTTADELGFGTERKQPSAVSKSIGGQINDLCSKLQAKGSSQCLGYLEDTGWRHTISSAQQSTASTGAGIVKIHDLLGGPSNPGTSPTSNSGLSIREKYHLALSMSFAVLQLFDTPWLSSHESFHDIHLITSSNDPAQPYILKQLQQSPHSTAPTNIANKMHRIGVQNEILFQLGVLLLEISYGQPLSKLRTPSDLDAAGNETILTDYLVAVRLADEIVIRESPKYSDAVRRCLFCRFPCTSTNLGDVELQEEFHGGVVAPLLEIYNFFS